MASKFLNILSDKVKFNKTKLEINTHNLGLDDNKTYEVNIPQTAIVTENKELTQSPTITFTVANRMTTLPSGRKIYRHKNDEGSVLRFDMFGSEINLFVPDCKYRTVLKWGTFGTNSPLPDLTDLGSMNFIHGSSDPIELTDTIPVVTDAELQANYHNLVTMDHTARHNCDIWLSYKNSTDADSILGVPQVEYARSLTQFEDIDYCDIPNCYQLMVLYLEQDAIDSYDKYKDDSRYNDCLLSSLNPVQRWSFKNKATCALASTEFGEYYVWGMCYRGGYEGGVGENEESGCIPVCEF